MGKVSLADNMRMLMLREQSYGAKAMMAAYPLKNWKLSMVKKTCQQVDATGLATECKAGSGRTTLAVSFPVLSMTALDCYPVDTSSSKMACQHTQLVPRRTGSKPTAQISLPKTCGLQTHPI